MASLSENQFAEPIKNLFIELKPNNNKFEFPFIPQIIKAIVIGIILIVLSILYCSIGILSQVSTLLRDLMEDAGEKIKEGSFINASGYAVAYAIYLIIFIPFFLVQTPFLLIGYVYHKSRISFTIFIIASIIAICTIIMIIRIQ